MKSFLLITKSFLLVAALSVHDTVAFQRVTFPLASHNVAHQTNQPQLDLDRPTETVSHRHPLGPQLPRFLTPKRRICSLSMSYQIPTEVLTCLIPPCLGFYKSEYTVSFAYGLSTAATAWVVWNKCASPSSLLALQAGALVFYGVRLNAFLLIRNMLSQRIQEFNQRVETRAQARGNRLQRFPFIISCGVLYYCLCAPLLVTLKLAGSESVPGGTLARILQTLVGVQWFGFLLAALGDLTKTWVKQTQKDESYLVTSGIFSILRHPNYTGEILGWSANALIGWIGAVFLFLQKGRPYSSWPSMLFEATIIGIGWVGIVSVLLRATGNLEAKQRKDYQANPRYEKWVASSWSGWLVPKKEEPEETSEPEKAAPS